MFFRLVNQEGSRETQANSERREWEYLGTSLRGLCAERGRKKKRRRKERGEVDSWKAEGESELRRVRISFPYIEIER